MHAPAHAHVHILTHRYIYIYTYTFTFNAILRLGVKVDFYLSNYCLISLNFDNQMTFVQLLFLNILV